MRLWRREQTPCIFYVPQVLDLLDSWRNPLYTVFNVPICFHSSTNICLRKGDSSHNRLHRKGFSRTLFIIPNEKEASILTGKSDPVKSAGIFIEHGANTVIIKCGKEGCYYKNASEDGHIPAYPDVKVVDTTGAGDSFVAGFIHGLSIGLSLQDSCRYGCAVSSVVVEHMGTQGITEISYEAKRRYQSLENG